VDENDIDIHTIRDERDSIRRKGRNSGSQNRREGNNPMEHMVDSYEIYGEN